MSMVNEVFDSSNSIRPSMVTDTNDRVGAIAVQHDVQAHSPLATIIAFSPLSGAIQ